MAGFMPIIMLVVIGILTFNAQEFRVETLRPILAEGFYPIIMTVKKTIFAFSGYELLFFFMAYMKKSDLRALPLNITIGIVTLLYILVTVFSFSLFSFEAVKYITFPTIELAKEIDIPGAFLERLESSMMAVWIMTIFNTLAIDHFLAFSVLKNQIFVDNNFLKTKQFPGSILPFVVQFIIFIIAFIPKSITEAFTFSDWIDWLGAALILTTISLGYLTVWVRAYKK